MIQEKLTDKYIRNWKETDECREAAPEREEAPLTKGWFRRTMAEISRENNKKKQVDLQMQAYREKDNTQAQQSRKNDKFIKALDEAYAKIEQAEENSPEQYDAIAEWQLLQSSEISPRADDMRIVGKQYGDSGLYKVSQYTEMDHETAVRAGKKAWETHKKRASGELPPKPIRDLSGVISTYRHFEELALCNPFDWFVTLTLDGSKIGGYEKRYDYESFKSIGKFIQEERMRLAIQSEETKEAYRKEYRRRRENGATSKEASKNNHSSLSGIVEITYLLCREKHKNGAWHFHGLMKLPKEELELIEPGMKQIKYWSLPAKTRDYAKKTPTYIWPAYYEKYGLNTFTIIANDSTEAKLSITNYCRKYISKSVQEDNANNSGRHYLRSKGMNRANKMFLLKAAGSIKLADVKEYALRIVDNYCYCISAMLPKDLFYRFVSRYGIMEA
jgi:hypothetical protein